MGRGFIASICNNRLWNIVAIMLLCLAADYLTPYLYTVYDQNEYLGMHTVIEFVAILIAFSICSIVWLMRDGFEDFSARLILIFGLTFAAVGLVDMMHVLSYDGMPAFVTESSAQKATVLWLYSRYLVAIGFILALLWPKGTDVRRLTNGIITVMLVLVVVAFCLATRYIDRLPDLFTVKVGQTPLKVNLEYALMAIYSLEAVLLLVYRGKVKEIVFFDLFNFLLLSAISEFTLTFYENVYDTYNFLGHIYKLIAYYFLFKAVFLGGIVNHFYTLSEMGKMSAELLKEKISLEAVLHIQMVKLLKLIPHAEQISVQFICGDNCIRTVYSWGRFSELFPINSESKFKRIAQVMGNDIRVITSPVRVLQSINSECSPPVSVILKASKELMYIPLIAKGEIHGSISLYIFNSKRHFLADDVEKALVFQHFATLAITQAKNQETITKLSYEDSLTELPNRRWFFEELAKVKYDAEHYGVPFTIVYIDMNDLKYLNDYVGHEAGDAALELIGQTLRTVARQSDVPARLGGDEFGIIFRHMGLAEAEQKINELKAQFQQIELFEYNHVISLAIGGASFPDETKSEEELLKLADDRMYEHKRLMKAANKTE